MKLLSFQKYLFLRWLPRVFKNSLAVKRKLEHES